MRRMMVVTAHPDDEAGGFGGVLRMYAERGAETCVLCLTSGQAASNRGGAASDEELSAMRRKELAASAEILKITRLMVLGYRDGALDRADTRQVVGEVVRCMREFRPQVVLTFGPEGAITAHPDHSMASVFASLAFHWAGREGRFPEQFSATIRPHRAQKLYYVTASFTLEDRPPVSLPPATAVVDIGPYVETKIAAFKAHSSQTPLFSMFQEHVRRRGSVELFHLAANVHPGPVVQENDLFAGVVDAE